MKIAQEKYYERLSLDCKHQCDILTLDLEQDLQTHLLFLNSKYKEKEKEKDKDKTKIRTLPRKEEDIVIDGQSKSSNSSSPYNPIEEIYNTDYSKISEEKLLQLQVLLKKYYVYEENIGKVAIIEKYTAKRSLFSHPKVCVL